MSFDQRKAQEFEELLANLGPLPQVPTTRAPAAPQPEEPAYDPVQVVEQSQPAADPVDVKGYIAKKYGFSDSSNSDALAEAEDVARQKRAIAGYGEAFDQIGASIAGVKSDPSFYREQAKNANTGVDRVQRARKGEIEDISMKNAGEENDPNSPLAQSLKRTYGKTLSSIGGDASILEGMSASQIKEYAAQPISEQVKMSMAKDAARAKVEAANALGSKKSDPNSPQQRRVGIYADKATSAAANDLHNDKNIGKLSALYQNVARGIHNVTPTMTYQVAHEVLQDYAAALSGMNATTDSRIAGITPEMLDEKKAAIATMVTSNPNRPIAPEFYKFLKEQGARLKDGFQNSVVSEVQRKSAGKKYQSPEMQRSFEEARDAYLNGDVFKKTDEAFATTHNAKYQDAGGAQRQVTRKQHNPGQNKTKLFYSDGTSEIVDGLQ